MKLLETDFDNLKVIQLDRHEDSRGAFTKIMSGNFYREWGLPQNFQQINFSHNNKKGTLRGMHFQCPPHAETKIIICLKGRVIDTLVDLRQNSETFLKTFTLELSEERPVAILAPKGFAHGFQTLEDNSSLLYLHDNNYEPSSEGSLNALDPVLNISWPLPVSERSDKDQKVAFLDSSFKGLRL